MKFCFLVGTRPETIKMAPLIKECQKRKYPHFLVHTNQHYDQRLDQIFFQDLRLDLPKYNLHVGSGSHGQTTAKMISGTEEILLKEKPSHLFVLGDTNTTIAGAIAVSKISGITLCHVEAGLRSRDREMPEEINRIVTDHCSDLLFCPNREQYRNLKKEGIDSKKLFITGNTIVDTVYYCLSLIKQQPPDLLGKLKINQAFILLTCHRPSNTDNLKNLRTILKAVNQICIQNGLICLFPIHPRTEKIINLSKIKLPSTIKVIPPVGYLQMIYLQKESQMVLTDSGGLQEEACILKKKCLILRLNTERPEVLTTNGARILTEISEKEIISQYEHLVSATPKWKKMFGDGHAASKILAVIQKT